MLDRTNQVHVVGLLASLGVCILRSEVYDRGVESEHSLSEDIQRIRDRLRDMRAEREAAMHRLAASREHAEAQRQVRADALPQASPPTHTS